MLIPNLHESGFNYLLLFNHFKFMSHYLYFPYNLKDEKDHL